MFRERERGILRVREGYIKCYCFRYIYRKRNIGDYAFRDRERERLGFNMDLERERDRGGSLDGHWWREKGGRGMSGLWRLE